MSRRINLTTGEHLYLWRRRKELSQNAAGQKLHLPRNHFASIERDELEWPRARKSLPTLVLPLSDQELCVVHRKRSGMTQRQVAKEIGISRYWVNCLEQGHGDITELARYWGVR